MDMTRVIPVQRREIVFPVQPVSQFIVDMYCDLRLNKPRKSNSSRNLNILKMWYFTGESVGIKQSHRLAIPYLSNLQKSHNTWLQLLLLRPTRKTRRFSNGAESTRTEFPVQNAYDLLGVSETCSFAEIKASFRKLAKETHPDLAGSNDHPAASRKFVQILAAYEILSDSVKRAHYDRYLLSQSKLMQKQNVQCSKLHVHESNVRTFKELEVVEWLKWYRLAINDIVLGKKVVVGTGYFDVLERDFYSAIHAAYYGPEIESMELLPDCFEAEERSSNETPEVLHLVSGRDLFGMVCLANSVPEIPCSGKRKLPYFTYEGSGLSQSLENVNVCMDSEAQDDVGVPRVRATDFSSRDAFRELELHVSGKLVAVATRVPPKTYYEGRPQEDAEDCIHVFFKSHEDQEHTRCGVSQSGLSCEAAGTRIPLGTITGVGTTPEEGVCYVYNSNGTKTHVIMKHRTMMVKHMHWYPVGEEVSVCECRCTRARLPPSKFWLFEPRCGLHDIGGWYIEMYGRDKKGRTIPTQRFWDGINDREQLEGRLHPAMYLLALAYGTLDLEDAKFRKQMLWNAMEGRIFGFLHWCRKLV